MKFPADHTGDLFVLLHSCALINPVSGSGADPGIGTDNIAGRVGPHQLISVGTFVGQGGDRVELPRALRRPEDADPLKRPVTRIEQDLSEDGVAGEEPDIHPRRHGVLEIAKHFDRPVFVMPHAEKSAGSQQPLWIAVGIEIGDVGDVIPLRFHPVRQREFPEKPVA